MLFKELTVFSHSEDLSEDVMWIYSFKQKWHESSCWVFRCGGCCCWTMLPTNKKLGKRTTSKGILKEKQQRFILIALNCACSYFQHFSGFVIIQILSRGLLWARGNFCPADIFFLLLSFARVVGAPSMLNHTRNIFRGISFWILTWPVKKKTLREPLRSKCNTSLLSGGALPPWLTGRRARGFRPANTWQTRLLPVSQPTQ